MKLVLRPPGRGNWSALVLDISEPGKHGPLPIEVFVGQLLTIAGKVFRVSKVMP